MAARGERSRRASAARIGGPFAPAALAIVLLGGCTAGPEPDLSLTCQLAACTCQTDAPFYAAATTAAVLWRDNGEAYCPEGFTLTLAE